MVFGGFYGPVKRGKLPYDPTPNAAELKALKQAETSNLLEGYTDQGSPGDPNYEKGGVGKMFKETGRERFNLWEFPGGGHKYAEEFRQEQQKGIRDAIAREKQKSAEAATPKATVPEQGLEGGPGGEKPSEGDVEFGDIQVGTPTDKSGAPITGGAGTPGLGGGSGNDRLIKGRKPTPGEMGMDLKAPKRTPTREDMGGGMDSPGGYPDPVGSPDPAFGGGDEPIEPYQQTGRGRGGLRGAEEIDPLVPGGIPWMNEIQRRKYLTEQGAKHGTEGPTQQDPDLSPEAMKNRRVPGTVGRGRSINLPTSRLDRANDAQAQPRATTGTIGVQIEHNGTKATAKTKTDGELFDKTKVKTQNAAQAESGAGV